MPGNKDLKRIIRMMLYEPERERRNDLPDFVYLRNLQTQVLLLDSTTAGKKIDELKEDIQRADSRYASMEPYFLIFLSYAYSLLSLGGDSVYYARKVQPYAWKNNEWNLGLYYWFMGIVFLENNYVEEARNEFSSAQTTLEKYCGLTPGKYKRGKVCKLIISKIQKNITKLPARQTHLPGAAAASFLSAKTNPGDGLKKDQKSDSPAPMNISIQIPVDIRSSDIFDQTSGQNQHNQQNPESVLTGNSQSELDPLGWLRLARKEKPALEENEIPVEVAEDIAGLFDQSFVFTPSLPLYGGASLGLDGIPILDDPDYSAVVDEIRLIKIFGEEYIITSLQKGDNQISISITDLRNSILDPEVTTTLRLNGKKYGWLKVLGYSMNKARPIPIETNDYVMFYELQNLSFCVGKIVIASLPNLEKNTTRLMVKRLVKIGKEYFFRSESEYMTDPTTGDDYLKDVPVVGATQLVGIVLAVASPWKKNAS